MVLLDVLKLKAQFVGQVVKRGRVKPRTKEIFAILFQNLEPLSKFGKR